MTTKQHKIGIIGYGYLGGSLHRALEGSEIMVSRIFNRSPHNLAEVPDGIATTDMDAFLESLGELDLVVELAHPDISREFGEQILQCTNYLLCSVTALADDDLRERLVATAIESDTHLLIPHGAVTGMDSLLEAGDNWQSASITFRKPPDSIDLEEALQQDETILFDGSVREVAAKFPRNVNAMVACALATVGLDAARGRFVADRRLKNRVCGEFEFTGKDGARLTIIKEEPASGVSGTGMIGSLRGSVIRALGQPGVGLNFV
jgi:aspartate dehydrogenase